MAKEKQAAAGGDFDLGFTPEEYEQLQPNQGLSFRRIMFGDYTFEVTAAEAQPTKNATKPHTMLKVTVRVIAAADDANKSEIGSETSSLYGGSPQSPDFMKQRLKALCVATGVSPAKGGKLTASMFIGKRFDASIVWELSASNKLDDFGRPKMYVNDRVKGERKVGAERPTLLNPAAESAKAQQYLDKGAGGEAPPWEAGAVDTGAGAGAIEGAGDATAGDEAEGFISEDQVDGLGHAYRAALKLGDESAREILIGAGIDPEGPINPELIEDPAMRADYVAKFVTPAAAKKPGLPPLNGSRPKTGTRAPAAAR